MMDSNNKNSIKKAIIATLGYSRMKPSEAEYTFSTDEKYNFSDEKVYNHKNMLPVLIEKYSSYDIVPIYTKEAKEYNENILKDYGHEQDYINKLFSNGKEIEEQDFEGTFAKINEVINIKQYKKIIVDVSHGFRHLPILAIVALIIHNLQDTKKIERILFAKEIEAYKKYEIIDLKEYLDIANISFILTAFSDNYTVASHIKSKKYPELIDALRMFSNDIMSLNITNIYSHSAKNLLNELEKIDNIEIKFQSNILQGHIQEILDWKDKLLYERYYNFAKILFDKDYLFLAVAFMFESLRIYIVDAFKNEDQYLYNNIKEITLREKSENFYAICDIFVRLLKKRYQGRTLNKEVFLKIFKQEHKERADKIIKTGSIKIPNILNNKIENLYKDIEVFRNSLAHIEKNTNNNIKSDTQKLMNRYYSLVSQRLSNESNTKSNFQQE